MGMSNGLSSASSHHHFPTPLGSSAVDSTTFAQTPFQSPTQERAPPIAPQFSGFSMMAEPSTGPDATGYGQHSGNVSPHTSLGKTVTFELLFSDVNKTHARIPLRVTIFPHDTTDSIVSTVRNFFGLYRPSIGISFEDDRKNTLIARWDNFRDRMTVFVRVIEEMTPLSPARGGFSDERGYPAAVPQKLDEAPRMAPRPQQVYGQHIAGPMSGVRSPSPNSFRGRRSTSAGIAGRNGRSRSAKHSSPACQDGYASGDGAPTSSFSRSKDIPHNPEISVENIVEGGRRKRARVEFDSSELPLYAPTQMPAATSTSSVSPARRNDHHRHSLPAVHGGPNPFSNPRPLQSPQQPYANGYGLYTMYQTPGIESRRSRASYGYTHDPAAVPVNGVMPTPEPTIGTCISEEDKDVAIQLMRLGDRGNMSHGRRSGSTYEDMFSARANTTPSSATSDAEDNDDDGHEASTQRGPKMDMAADKPMFSTTESHFAIPQPSVEASDDGHGSAGIGSMAAPKMKGKSSDGAKARPLAKTKSTKPVKPRSKKAASAGPMSPASLPASRKQSVASSKDLEHPDLSSKPRCQRCRKSKKGCNRERPCKRCSEAGLTIADCISEDEGNGRKGRYGRHMGVPLVGKDMVKTETVKKESPPATPSLLPAAPIAMAGGDPAAMASIPDKNKKRKR